jgi:hypothetical protein
VIQRELQNQLALELLDGCIQDGDTVHVTASALGLLRRAVTSAPKPRALPCSEDRQGRRRRSRVSGQAVLRRAREVDPS